MQSHDIGVAVLLLGLSKLIACAPFRILYTNVCGCEKHLWTIGFRFLSSVLAYLFSFEGRGRIPYTMCNTGRIGRPNY